MVGIGSALAVAGLARTQHVSNTQGGMEPVQQPALWPLLLGAIAFLFLWKLAAILFDLTFIWHRYIRLNVMLRWFRKNLI